MILILVFIYAHLATENFQGEFNKEVIAYYNDTDEDWFDGDEDICSTMFKCTVNFFNYGLKFGGGISETMLNPRYKDKYHYWMRWIFDVSFFLIINIFVLNVIAGIIIDTFTDLRETEAK